MIRNVADEESENVREGIVSQRLPRDIQAVARRKLRMLNSARHLDDVRIPLENRLEALKGNRRGQYSIRINDQRRICFRWDAGDASWVEIVDFH